MTSLPTNSSQLQTAPFQSTSSQATPTQRSFRMTYANTVQVNTKEQAIVLDSIEGLTVEDYAVAIGNIVEPINVRYISRISRGRICLYLSSKTIAENLITNIVKVNIKQHTLQIKPLVSVSKRVIISNVDPIIPSSLILQELEKLDINPKSSISELKAAINAPGYGHVHSFRRQIYIDPNEIEKLPANLKLHFNDSIFWIYFSIDKLTCFLCKEEGHLARHCKNSEYSKQNNNTTQIQKEINEDVNLSSNVDILKDNSENEKNSQKNDETPMENSDILTTTFNSFKRPLDLDTISTTSTKDSTNENNSQSIKKFPKKKKSKTTTVKTPPPSLDSIEKLLLPAKNHIKSNAQRYPMNFEQLKNYIQDTYGKDEIISITKTYTNNSTDLTDMLTEIYPHLIERKIKSQITRIKNKILNPNATESSNDEFSSTEDTLINQ